MIDRITAYVVKVFSMAHSIMGIEKQQVCDPLVYLVTNKLRENKGMYVEDNPVYSTTMTVRHTCTYTATHSHCEVGNLCGFHSKREKFSFPGPCIVSLVNYQN